MNTNMLSEAGLNMLTTLEGVRYNSYKDTNGLWTIGVGHLITDHDINLARILGIDSADIDPSNLVLTDREVTDLLCLDTEDRIAQINKRLTRPVSQRQMDSLVSFVYNMGIGNFEHDHSGEGRPSLLDTVNTIGISSNTIADTILKYCTVQGRPLQGRLKRRYIEASVFMLPETLDVPEGLTDVYIHDALDIITNYKVDYAKEFNSTSV